MNLQTIGRDRILGLHTAAKRLHIPERTLRYRASRGRIPGAFKQGKLWKFALSALAGAQRRSLVAAILCLVWLTGSHAQVTGAASRKPAPDFTLSDSNGRDVRLSQLQGKVVLVNFWATWCHGCKEEIPWLMDYQDRYKSAGLAIIGVAMDEDGWASVAPYLKEHKMNYPIVIGNEDVANRYGGVDGLPSTFVIDRQGRIAAAHTGMIDRDKCESEIRSLLAETARP